MKKFLALIIFSVILSYIQAQVSFQIEEMNKITGSTITPKFTALVEYTPTGKQFGGFVFTQTKLDWAQFILGATYTPKLKKLDVLEFSVGVGIEQATTPWRIQSSIFLRKKHLSFLGVFEYGRGGYLYLLSPTYEIHGWLIGVRAHRYYGIGPTFGYTIGHLTLWVSPMYEIEQKKFTGTVTIATRF